MYARRFFTAAAGIALLAAPATISAELPAGAKAPAFSTQGALAGKSFDFDLQKQLKEGPVVLYFYPKAFTQGCTLEANAFAENMPEFEAAGATVVRHSENLGKGVALMTGFAWAKGRDCEAVVTLDADGQHDPQDIPKLVAAYRAGAGDLIIGRRDFSRMPFPRSLTNPFGSWLLSLVLGTKVLDNQSGFRVYGCRLLETLELESTGLEAEVEAIARTLSSGLKIGWADVRTIYGTGKRSSFHPIADSARFLKTVWKARKHRVRSQGRCEKDALRGG